jgi:hypothetical protein
VGSVCGVQMAVLGGRSMRSCWKEQVCVCVWGGVYSSMLDMHTPVCPHLRQWFHEGLIVINGWRAHPALVLPNTCNIGRVAPVFCRWMAS